jgi:hypothetical protein
MVHRQRSPLTLRRRNGDSALERFSNCAQLIVVQALAHSSDDVPARRMLPRFEKRSSSLQAIVHPRLGLLRAEIRGVNPCNTGDLVRIRDRLVLAAPG